MKLIDVPKLHITTVTECRKLDLIELHKKCCVKTKLSDTSTKKIKRMRTQIRHSFGDSYKAMTKP